MLSRIAPLVAAALLLCTSITWAAPGKTWTTSGTQDFAEGELEGVSVLATGELELAPRTEQIEGLEAEFVWDAQADEDGNVYVATGAPAAVWHVQGARVNQVYAAPEQQHVLSVLPLPDGAVLAATAPDGVVRRISRTGQVSTLAALKASYVWDMAFTPLHEIYCATGPEGRLFQLDRAGQVTERLKTEQSNLTCVAATQDGTVYVGTEPEGYIYVIQRDGQARILYDAEENAISDLLVAEQGLLYAATAQGQQAGGPARRAPNGGPESQTGQLPSPATARGAPNASNAIYRITPGEGASRVAEFSNTFVLTLGYAEGLLLAGLGPGGRLAGIDRGDVVRSVTDFETQHLTAIAVLPGGGAVVGGSNTGGLWRLSAENGKTGTFVSKVFDAGYLSRWGKLEWEQRAGTGQMVRVSIRTGNTREPNDYWSQWSDWAPDPSGTDLDIPTGRFAQFRAELTSRPQLGSPALLQVKVSYRQSNRRPVIEDVAVNGGSLLKRQQDQKQQQRRRNPQNPYAMTLAWKVSDPNQDDLSFSLYYRGTEETEWKPLETDIKEQPKYDWDTSRVPDGEYMLKLVASDAPSRPEGEALSDEKVTVPMTIDNRPPQAVSLEAVAREDGSYVITGVARDGHSSIRSIQISRNSGDWHPVFPDDGLLDSREEAFTYRTPVLEPGEQVLVVAVSDANDNTGSGKIVLNVCTPE